ncbi:MAG TPA: PQQ-dependent sugar dehydrogenase, partial [Polyangiaceae bacterium]|nr:PQQ-dependent sugar dehydrogenase [Polyangiaceae bacterium]
MSLVALSGCDRALAVHSNAHTGVGAPTADAARTDPQRPVAAGNDATAETTDDARPPALADADPPLSDANGRDGSARRDASDAQGITVTRCGLPVANEHPGNRCYNSPPPSLKVERLVAVSAIEAPVLLLAAPGDAARLFVVSRAGGVWIIQNGALLPEPFLDLTDTVSANSGGAEYGLLGMAFDPDFASNGKVWVHYNIDAQPLQSVTASVLVSQGDPNQADKSSLTPLFAVNQPYTNHNGGMISFGTDGCLYVGFGDGGSQNDPHGNGQNNAEPMGSILRVDPATGLAAPGNPGYMDARIWVYGLRNPWRFTFDDQTGDMYIGDVGQVSWEECDVAPAGIGDLNYGWDIMEGTHGHENYNGDPTGLRLPAKEYPHGSAAGKGHSVIGGRVYRGTHIPNMAGRYLYADYDNSHYWVFTYKGETAGNPSICDDYDISADLSGAQGPTAIGEDAAGELYITTL